MEGKCTGRYGFTILVTNVLFDAPGTMDGRLHIDTGFAHFPVTYLALVFKPFKNEILNAVVTEVNLQGVFCTAGPLHVFVATMHMPSDLKLDERKDGMPSYYSEEEEQRIEKGTKLRVKIVGLRTDADNIQAIGTIKEDFLGPAEEE